MDISIFLTQAFGLYFVIAGVAMLIKPRCIEDLMETFSNSRGLVVLMGFFILIIGIPLILVHNIWDGSWRVLITVFAWLTFFKGLTWVLVPESIGTWGKLLNNSGLVKGLLGLVVILGLYLLYIGFGV